MIPLSDLSTATQQQSNTATQQPQHQNPQGVIDELVTIAAAMDSITSMSVWSYAMSPLVNESLVHSPVQNKRKFVLHDLLINAFDYAITNLS